MTLNDYQRESARTAPRSMEAYPEVVQEAWLALPSSDAADSLLKLQDIHIWAHGLAGEAGEVCDLLKKVHGHGKPYEPDAMLKELGDVLWYLANLAVAHGFTLEQVAQANVDKLRTRYPEGFSVSAAAAKADEQVAEFEVRDLGDDLAVVNPVVIHPRLVGPANATHEERITRWPSDKAKTTDYCARCGSSPDSGVHIVAGHNYVPPLVERVTYGPLPVDANGSPISDVRG